MSNSVADLIFSQARSQNGWLDRPVSDEQLHALYEQLKWGPTSMNCSPARFVFLRTSEAKEKLKPALMPGNVDKTMSAPVVVIVGYDARFYDRLPELFPHNPAVKMLFEGEGKREIAHATAFRNGTLQGAYMIAAARSVGLDCAPMSGFSEAAVDQLFFGGTTVKSNFLCGLGYGDPAKLFPRGPRLAFDQACTFA
ncbi:malonic semialdehyde reductase [Trinickia violacea]|uniref:Putative NADH dehydrogenase/NAD(P)H nitroreductase FAZ95_25325 n=1 Tax=Trinickia violacea TaxID=2571746 RepID=A0A4P8IVL5_9BURK|nr:malonic semialdehyde reductase [Trinickia violacea]QCP52491.1 malonic semialdehyde reductase [Trinickia violacea]